MKRASLFNSRLWLALFFDIYSNVGKHIKMLWRMTVASMEILFRVWQMRIGFPCLLPTQNKG